MRDTELTARRDAALVAAYQKALGKLGRTAPFVRKRKVLDRILTAPAPRFYCSVEEASRVCSQILRGKGIARRGVRSAMYADLSRRVAAKLAENDLHTLRTAVMEAIEEPAPEWYIGIESALRIVNRSFKRRR